MTPARAGAWAASSVLLAHGLPSATRITALQRFLPKLAGRGRADHVALTFDDGPDERGTPPLLDLLAELGVRATFFLLGQQVVRSPDLARRIAAEGHEIALHGWHHRSSLLVPPAALRSSLHRAADAVTEASGHAPHWYRPPYGVATTSTFRTARELGLPTVLWTRMGRDWEPTASPASVLGNLGGTGPSDTVLLHDSDITSSPGSWRATLGAVRPLVGTLRAQGLSVGPLGEHLPLP